jgi:hypothetical protein
MSGKNAPICSCGCKQQVRWDANAKKWHTHVRGHYMRLRNHHPAAGHRPWNKGNNVSYKHVCLSCEKEFSNKFKEAVYCTHKCYTGDNTGDKSRLWKGGKKHTGYAVSNGEKTHHAIMKLMLGRDMMITEVVHHIDEDRYNNSPENLHLFHCDRCHTHHHMKKESGLRYVYPSVHFVA